MYCDVIAVGENWMLGVVCGNETGVEVIRFESLRFASLISILVVTACFCFRTRGGTPPFLPLPFGMFVVNRLVTQGTFLFLAERNS